MTIAVRHDAAMHLPRNQRRMLAKQEKRLRHSGDWGAWERIEFPHGPPSAIPGGWLSQVRAICKNRVFSVLFRHTEHAIHLGITSLREERPTWWEAQRIKNEICGEESYAIEIYPPQSEVVDGANMYHLWVLNEPLPITLVTKKKKQ